MTFDAYELGHGAPVELYKFIRGVTSFYLTSHDEDYTFDSVLYTSTLIDRTEVNQNQELEHSEITVSVPREHEVVTDFILYPPTEVMTLTIYKLHIIDGDEEFIIIWQGRVLVVEWSGEIADIKCEPVFTSLKRPGLRRQYQAQCPHLLYGPACRLTDNAFRVFGDITDITDNTITAPEWSAFADDYFAGGYIAAVTDKRSIVSSAGGVLTLTSAISGLVLNTSVAAFPGCKHNLDDCITKFNNVINYGGFPYVPEKNPFGGKILY